MFSSTKQRQKNLSQTTYVTGYWRIDNNQKKGPAHYQAFLPRTFALLRGGSLVVLHDDPEFLAQCERLAKRYDITLKGIRLELEQLPYYALRHEMLASCQSMAEVLARDPATYKKDKGSRHFTRHLPQSGPEAYGRLISIWLSKIALVNRVVIPQDPFASSYFAWIDISVARFNYLRKNWDFTKALFTDEKLHHYGTKSWYQGTKLKLNASFFCGTKTAWAELDQAFDQTLKQHCHDAYAHDEETLLHLLRQEQPELLASIGEMRGPRIRQVVEAYYRWRNQFFK